MKKINILIKNLILISIFAAFGCMTTAAQSSAGFALAEPAIADSERPFDFTDKFYYLNGVEPNLISNRVTGMDKFSVIDKTENENRRNVRIRATMPAYNYDGSILYWNLYGELFEKSFVQNEIGREALATANRFPIFVFPSTTEKEVNRQAALIEVREGYFEKNPLGLGVVVEVEYTLQAASDDSGILKEMANRNGVSLDGTPIIKTIDELNLLTAMQLVTQKIKGLDNPDEPSYVIAKVIANPEKSAIAPDAFLIYTAYTGGKPLEAEEVFIKNFDYLKSLSQ